MGWIVHKHNQLFFCIETRLDVYPWWGLCMLCYLQHIPCLNCLWANKSATTILQNALHRHLGLQDDMYIVFKHQIYCFPVVNTTYGFLWWYSNPMWDFWVRMSNIYCKLLVLQLILMCDNRHWNSECQIRSNVILWPTTCRKVGLRNVLEGL